MPPRRRLPHSRISPLGSRSLMCLHAAALRATAAEAARRDAPRPRLSHSCTSPPGRCLLMCLHAAALRATAAERGVPWLADAVACGGWRGVPRVAAADACMLAGTARARSRGPCCLAPHPVAGTKVDAACRGCLRWLTLRPYCLAPSCSAGTRVERDVPWSAAAVTCGGSRCACARAPVLSRALVTVAGARTECGTPRMAAAVPRAAAPCAILRDAPRSAAAVAARRWLCARALAPPALSRALPCGRRRDRGRHASSGCR